MLTITTSIQYFIGIYIYSNILLEYNLSIVRKK